MYTMFRKKNTAVAMRIAEVGANGRADAFH